MSSQHFAQLAEALSMYGQPIGRVAGRPSGAPETAAAQPPPRGASGVHAEQPLPPVSAPAPHDVLSEAHEKASQAMALISARNLHPDALAEAARRFDAIAQDNLPAGMLRALRAGVLSENARIGLAERHNLAAPAIEPVEAVYDEEHGRGRDAEDEEQEREQARAHSVSPPEVGRPAQRARGARADVKAELEEDEARLFETEETRIMRRVEVPQVAQRMTRPPRGKASRLQAKPVPVEAPPRSSPRREPSRLDTSTRARPEAAPRRRPEKVAPRPVAPRVRPEEPDASDRATERQLPATWMLESTLPERPTDRVAVRASAPARDPRQVTQASSPNRERRPAPRRPASAAPAPIRPSGAPDPRPSARSHGPAPHVSRGREVDLGLEGGARPNAVADRPRVRHAQTRTMAEGETLEGEIEKAWLEALERRGTSPEARALASSLAGRNHDRTPH